MGEASLLAQASLASTIFNLSSERFRDAPRDTRKGEAWTEAWGASDSDSDATKTIIPSKSEDWNVDRIAVAEMLGTKHPQQDITLYQYRPAWLEQLVLSMAGVRFVVVNSPYLASEATGPLPYLRELNKKSDSAPILVGRQHPQVLSTVPSDPSNSTIVDYLTTVRKIDLDATIRNDPRKMAQTKLVTSLVQNDLQRALQYLRYEDADAWEQVYRDQVIDASSPIISRTQPNSWFRPSKLGGMFQAWSERATVRQRLKPSTLGWNVETAVSKAREAYDVLEKQLESGTSGQYLLRQPKPTLVDAILWDHLAQALCDVHLVVVLSSFPCVVQYFQHIHQTFFTLKSNPSDWERWNFNQNRINPFQQQLPISKTRTMKAQYKDAVELMHSLSVHQHNLQEILDGTRQTREAEVWPVQGKQTESPFYRWRMGDDFDKEQQEGSKPDETSAHQKKMQREQARNDQVWMSGVVGVSMVAVLLLQGSVGDGQSS